MGAWKRNSLWRQTLGVCFVCFCLNHCRFLDTNFHLYPILPQFALKIDLQRAWQELVDKTPSHDDNNDTTWLKMDNSGSWRTPKIVCSSPDMEKNSVPWWFEWSLFTRWRYASMAVGSPPPVPTQQQHIIISANFVSIPEHFCPHWSLTDEENVATLQQQNCPMPLQCRVTSAYVYSRITMHGSLRTKIVYVQYSYSKISIQSGPRGYPLEI